MAASSLTAPARSWRVPRSRAEQTHLALREEILKALEPLIFEDVLCAKRVRRETEEAFATVVEQRFACAVHSGTVGLFLALRACGVGPGDEVITVGNSDISTTAAISHCGATPVLCDVLGADYTIDVDLVEPLLTSRTRVLLPVDLYGHPANVRQLRRLARRHGLRIVEDAALALGATDYGRPVGAFADATVFSFAPFKPLGSAGNGAMVVTDDTEIAERLQLLADYGHALDRSVFQVGKQSHVAEGYNVPIDALQAAIISVKLPYLAEWTARRREIAAQFDVGLAGTAIQRPAFRPEAEPTFRAYTILVPNQDAWYTELRAAGIEVVLHYAPAIYRQPVYPQGLRGSDELPVTDHLAHSLVCLPVTPELTDDDIHYTIETVLAIEKRLGGADQ